jgi:RHS repeat-associated protein
VNNRHTVRSETYTSFNMPSQIVYGNFVTSTTSTADRTLTFVYGPEHQRVKQTVQLSGSGTSSYKAGTTWYMNGIDSLGLSYEKEVQANGTTEHKHYVGVGADTFAIFVSRTGSLNGNPATTTSYLHKDHLGSVAAITNEAGTTVERLAYDPWGKRRQTNGTNDTADSIVGQKTERGYTMHEHLDEVGVIHMNARIYDPLIGRFMSADDVIPDPTDLKAFNRYSYVANNPLRLVDPTGHNYDEGLSGTTSSFGTDGLGGSNWGPDGGPNVENSYDGRSTSEKFGWTVTYNIKDGDSSVEAAHARQSKLDTYESEFAANAAATSGMTTATMASSGNSTATMGGPSVGIPSRGIDGVIRVLSAAIAAAVNAVMNSDQGSTDQPAPGTDAKPPTSGKEPPVEGATPGRETKGQSTQWGKGGGYDAANQDFDNQNPKNVRGLPGGGRVGTLDDGRTIVVRPDSTTGKPTLEIQDGRKRTKIRYDD